MYIKLVFVLSQIENRQSFLYNSLFGAKIENENKKTKVKYIMPTNK